MSLYDSKPGRKRMHSAHLRSFPSLPADRAVVEVNLVKVFGPEVEDAGGAVLVAFERRDDGLTDDHVIAINGASRTRRRRAVHRIVHKVGRCRCRIEISLRSVDAIAAKFERNGEATAAFDHRDPSFDSNFVA